MESPPQPKRDQVLRAILDASGRQSVPIRTAFVQQRVASGLAEPGPLASLVRRGRDSTLEQYLVLHAWASAGDFAVVRDARIWARALGLDDGEKGRRAVGRNWTALQDMKLVETSRRGRLVRAQLLREDGSGSPYGAHPGLGPKSDPYLQLPYEYWLGGYHERLTLPGRAVLLIALTLGDWFPLPTRRGPDWYGISRASLERGLQQARKESILEMQYAFKDAPLAPQGYTRENFFRLLPPFGPRGTLSRGAHPRFMR